MSLKYVALSWWSTSDVWTDAATGVGRVREEREREKESVSRKKINARRVEKSRHTVSLQCFAVPEGRKVGSLTRRMRS